MHTLLLSCTLVVRTVLKTALVLLHNYHENVFVCCCAHCTEQSFHEHTFSAHPDINFTNVDQIVFRGYNRSVTNDVRVTSCSAIVVPKKVCKKSYHAYSFEDEGNFS